MNKKWELFGCIVFAVVLVCSVRFLNTVVFEKDRVVVKIDNEQVYDGLPVGVQKVYGDGNFFPFWEKTTERRRLTGVRVMGGFLYLFEKKKYVSDDIRIRLFNENIRTNS